MKIKVFGTNTYIRIGTTKVVTVPDDSRKDEPKPNYWNMLRVRLENADGEAMPDTEFGVGIAVPCGDPLDDSEPNKPTPDKDKNGFVNQVKSVAKTAAVAAPAVAVAVVATPTVAAPMMGVAVATAAVGHIVHSD